MLPFRYDLLILEPNHDTPQFQDFYVIWNFYFFLCMAQFEQRGRAAGVVEEARVNSVTSLMVLVTDSSPGPATPIQKGDV